MLRYIGISGGFGNPRTEHLAQGIRAKLHAAIPDLHELVRLPNLTVHTLTDASMGAELHTLCGDTGIVLGTVFRKSTSGDVANQAPIQWDYPNSQRIAATRGRYLVEAYWGSYVAFLHDTAANTIRVLRDPTGAVPCYRTTIDGVTLFFSSLADVSALGLRNFTIKWDTMAVRVISGSAWEDESALNEVSTVRAGECVTLDGRGLASTLYWHPFQIERSERILDPRQAASEMRSVVRHCVHAWASQHDSVIHELSGGLDSAIVLAFLADAPTQPKVTCVNFRTRDLDSDERAYAQLAAARANSELVEHYRDRPVNLHQLLAFPPTLSPRNIVMQCLEIQPVLRDLARRHSASATFSGDGGDQVFVRGWSGFSVIDFARCRGFNSDLLRFVSDMALLSKQSFWNLLAQATWYGVFRRKKTDFMSLLLSHRKLLTSDAADSVLRYSDFLNPWGLPIDGISPGQVMQAFDATRPFVFHDPLRCSDDPSPICPLASQPVVELCLRIPTFVHLYNGNDRAVARLAFRSDVPGEILGRHWKGSVDRHFKDFLMQNIKFARELMLDGELVKRHILDRQKLEDALSGVPTRSGSYVSEVFDYICIEAWIQRCMLPNVPDRQVASEIPASVLTARYN
jgi:asparagine synthase (glutamine-hydrolysing)